MLALGFVACANDDDDDDTTTTTGDEPTVTYAVGDILGARTLGVGLTNTRDENTTTPAIQWAVSSAVGYGANIEALRCTTSVVDENGGAADTATYTGVLNGTGSYANFWYLPSIAELSKLNPVKETVNASLSAAGGMQLAEDSYWSSSQKTDFPTRAWYLDILHGQLNANPKYYDKYVCAIRQF